MNSEIFSIFRNDGKRILVEYCLRSCNRTTRAAQKVPKVPSVTCTSVVYKKWNNRKFIKI